MTRSGDRPADVPLPLAGMRVVDFSRQISAPYATMLLGDLGADVIKIEQPGTGDDTRRLQPTRGDLSSVFIAMNRNKRSIELDLKSPDDLSVAKDLIAGADILVENFTTGVMHRYGLDYETLAAKYPGLIYCSVTGYGQRGAFATRPGFDPVVQADCGLQSVNGYANAPPVRIAAPAIDVATGMMTLNAIQAAVIARLRNGRGQKVEVALFDVGVALSAYFPVTYLWHGADQGRTGNRSQVGAPADLFSASDGDFVMSCSTDRMFVALARSVIDRPDLADDPDFATNGARLRNHAALTAILAPIFRQRTRAAWAEAMQAVGIPAAGVRSVAEAVESPEAKDRGLFGHLDHPVAGRVPNVAPPFRLEGVAMPQPRPAPALGADTREVLRDVLGYTDDRIDRFMAGRPATTVRHG
ncbi:CaiB/BaiF CoA transferase family protein [Sphingomonas sp.]|uniref:CaiB/BaiF CoA transferase family protein n=1 Tax=Sphingomonas sp. TaxID=28214 RepID=UPI002DD6966D|nr:CoA transferase [Sphingomonas sp.]